MHKCRCQRPKFRYARRDAQISNDHELARLKIAEFHGASYAAWFNTALEKDKSILTLSASGIGLLVTLSSSLSSTTDAILYVAALLSFLSSLAIVLFIFSANKKLIEKTLADDNGDGKLKFLDSAALLSFGLGVLFSAVIGVSAGFESILNKKLKAQLDSTTASQCVKDEKMTEEKSKNSNLNKSFENLKNIKPKEPLHESFDGMKNIKPSQGNTPPPPPPAINNNEKK